MHNIFYAAKNYSKSHHQLAMLSIVGFLAAFSRGIFISYIPAYINSYVASFFLVGVIYALPKFVALFVDLSISSLFRTFQKKFIILFAFLLFIIVGFTFFLVDGFLGVILGLLLYGLASDLYYVPLYAKMMASSKRSEDSHDNAIFKSFSSLGWTIGPLVGGFIVGSLFSGDIFVFFSLICFLSFLIVLSLIKSEPIEHIPKISFKDGVKALFNLNKKVKVPIAVSTFISFWDGSMWMAIPLFVLHNGLGSQYSGLMLMLFTLPYLLFRVPAGVYEDRHSKSSILFPLLLLGAVCFMLIPVVNTVFMIVLLFLISVTGAIMSPACGGLIVDHSSKKERDSAASLEVFIENFVFLIVRVLGGLVLFLFSFNGMFLFVALSTLVVAFLVKRFYSKLENNIVTTSE